MQNIKILMVNLGFPPESLGGTEYYTLNASKSLIQNGHTVGVFCALNNLSKKRYSVTRSVQEGIQVYRVANSHLHARRFNDFFLDKTIDSIFSTVLKEFKPDLIHFHHLAYLSAKLPEIADSLNIPSVMTLHDYWYFCFRSRLLNHNNEICAGPNGGRQCATCDNGKTSHPMKVAKYPKLLELSHSPSIKKLITAGLQAVPPEKISAVRNIVSGNSASNTTEIAEPTIETINNQAFRFITFKNQFGFPKVILSPSRHLKQRYEDAGFNNVDYLPLGFKACNALPPIPYQNSLKLTFIGSLEPHKGLCELLNELRLVDTESIDLEVNVHGHAKDPIYASKLLKTAAALKNIRVNFHGAYQSDKDLRTILKNCHFVIFPSIWEENHPLVVREAILHGRPVIASNLGGASECINHLKNGVLYNPLNPGELKQLIHQLSDPLLIDALQEGARKSKIITMDEHISQLVKIYKNIINPIAFEKPPVSSSQSTAH